MKRTVNKIVLYFLCFSLILSSMILLKVGAFAAPEGEYAESMQRLMDLGIFSETSPEKMDLNRKITREEFAAVLVRLNGVEDQLPLYENRSAYSDVDTARWSSPYIQLAVKNGYMASMPDGRFHPAEAVSFAQAATILGRLLKYETSALSGSYPQNYLILLDDLELLDGISYTANASVTRGQLSLMLGRLFDAKVYDSEQTFVEALPNIQEGIVLENGITNPDGDDRRIVTDKGTLYLKEGLDIPEAGKQYLFVIGNDEIQREAAAALEYDELSVCSVSNGTVVANDGEKAALPAGITYYYQGSATDYDSVHSSIQANSSIVIGYDGDEAVYAALFDPLFSQPEVITADKAGAPLEMAYRGLFIEKEGKTILPSQIEVNDVVYKVTDIWRKNGYVLVYNNTVSGTITAISPNKISPVSIEIGGMTYNLDESFPKEKISASGRIETGESARLIIGSEGTAVDIISDSISGTEYYALVLNAYTENSVESVDYGTPYYYVTLLHSDGGKKTYLVNKSKLSLRGKLVTYEITDEGDEYDTVSLKAVDYESHGYGSYKIDKDERMIGDDYVANGAVIFNIRSTAKAEIDASVITFGDLLPGSLMKEKIEYMHQSGDFSDIDILVLDDALDESTAYGLVTGKNTTGNMMGEEFVKTETLTFLVNGQTMTWQDNDETGLYTGAVARIALDGDAIDSVGSQITAQEYADEIEAVDSSRIKVNGRVYTYHKNLSIYKQKGKSGWKTLETSDLTKGTDTGSVTLYLDKPASYGGKVVMILIR